MRAVGTIAPDDFERAASFSHGHSQTEDLFRDVFAGSHTFTLIEMDEFDHDIIVPLQPNLVLVYDTT